MLLTALLALPSLKHFRCRGSRVGWLLRSACFHLDSTLPGSIVCWRLAWPLHAAVAFDIRCCCMSGCPQVSLGSQLHDNRAMSLPDDGALLQRLVNRLVLLDLGRLLLTELKHLQHASVCTLLDASSSTELHQLR